jgi:hypothetical protein
VSCWSEIEHLLITDSTQPISTVLGLGLHRHGIDLYIIYLEWGGIATELQLILIWQNVELEELSHILSRHSDMHMYAWPYARCRP